MENTGKKHIIRRGSSPEVARDEAIRLAAVQLADILIQYDIWKRRHGPAWAGTTIQSGAQIGSRDKVQPGD